MANLFQGDPLPQVQSSATSTPNVPEYYQNYLSNLAQTGTSQLSTNPDALVAGFSDLQNQGFGGVGAAANAYQPNLNAAQQTVNSAVGSYQPGLNAATNLAGQSTNVGQQQIQNFMNPYTGAVVDEMGRLTQQNVQRNILPALKAAFASTGSSGSSRYANATGQTLADIQANLTGQQSNALQTGFNQSVNQALQNAQLGQSGANLLGNLAGQQQTLGLQGAQAQANLGGLQQQLGLTGANAQLQAGALQQALQQARLDAPTTRAANVAKILAGLNIPIGSSTQSSNPGQQGNFGLSPLAQIGSIASLIGAIPNGSGGTLGSSALGALGNFVGGIFNSGSPGSTDLTGFQTPYQAPTYTGATTYTPYNPSTDYTGSLLGDLTGGI